MSDTHPADPASPPLAAPESDPRPRREAGAADAAPRGAAEYAGGVRERRDGPPGERREGRGRPRQGGRPFYRKKFCKFCARSGSAAVIIDYKEIDTLRRYTTDRGKILPRRVTGNCAKCQRKLSAAIKRARALALLPFTAQ
jgi:small subunit ribosomal protein S18